MSDLGKLFFLSEKHLLVALQCIDDLIIEMSYVHKVKNLNISRRISLSFRDSALFQIFKQCLELVQRYTDSLTT